MAQPIYLKLEGRDEVLRPGSFVLAVRYFWGILRDLDAAISSDPRGTADWTLGNITRSSPAVIPFIGHSLLTNVDHTPQIAAECVAGLHSLEMWGERPAAYSDAAIRKVQRLAGLRAGRARDRLSFIEVFTDSGDKATIGPNTLNNLRSLMETRYESIGSVVGSLDSITVHAGNEFRVWQELTGRAVTCRFPKEMLDKVKGVLGYRVIVHGEVKANYKAEPTLIIVEGFERYADESKLPTIEEMAGLVDDFTGGLSLKDYLEEIRNG